MRSSRQGQRWSLRASPWSRYLRAALARWAKLWKPRVFVPNYSDEALLRMVAPSLEADQRHPVTETTTRQRGNDTTSERRSVATRLDRLITSRWFADFPVLRAELACDPRLAAWLRAAEDRTGEARHVGLAMPGGRRALLQAGFPWKGVANAVAEDLLFAVFPHRFGFMPKLAMAVASGAAPATYMLEILNDWMRFAHSQIALPFHSNLAVFQRLLANAWSFVYLGGVVDDREVLDCRFTLLKIIGQDIRFLVPRLGASYPNNHLLVDRFAAWFIGLVLPEMQGTPSRLEAAEVAWVNELRNQTNSDGGSIEHSVHYHGLACELAAAYLLLSRRTGRVVAKVDLRHIERMLRLQAELCGADGVSPSIGDSSDDPLFPPDTGIGGNAVALREIYRALFAPGMVPVRSDHPALERAFWLLGGRFASTPKSTRTAAYSEYPDTGLAVFSDEKDTTRCVLRTAAAIGTRVLPGHMHSDLMSVTVTCHGTPLLIDAGTYTYRFKPDRTTAAGVNWRAYFAGPRAHNGLVVDGCDPLGALTRNFRKEFLVPTVTRVASGGNDHLAFHESELQPQPYFPGFVRGIVHLRGMGFLVYQAIRSTETTHRSRLAFQLAPGCCVHRIDDTHFRVQHGAIALAIAYSAGIGPMEEVSGREVPTNGWASPRYAERVPAPQLLFDAISGQFNAYAMYGSHVPKSFSIECHQPSVSSRAFRIRSDTATDIVLLNLEEPDTEVVQWGVSFRGRLGWLRIPASGLPVLRCLNGISCDAPIHGLSHHVDALHSDRPS